jgi:hypothetical protein
VREVGKGGVFRTLHAKRGLEAGTRTMRSASRRALAPVRTACTFGVERENERRGEKSIPSFLRVQNTSRYKSMSFVRLVLLLLRRVTFRESAKEAASLEVVPPTSPPCLIPHSARVVSLTLLSSQDHAWNYRPLPPPLPSPQPRWTLDRQRLVRPGCGPDVLEGAVQGAGHR